MFNILHTKNILPAAIEGGIHLETRLYSSAFSQTCLHILTIFFPKLSFEQNLSIKSIDFVVLLCYTQSFGNYLN